ncbi:MAG: ornithine carbamoyltransferase [Gaiellaceae bacterium]|jgi:ornithine carbamoyltransferase|nr:MAG: ornithine carbamoyltransferase [Gaiellaceae bacterium]
MSTVPPIPAHLLEIGDLERASIEALLDLAMVMKARPHGFVEALRGDTVVCYFEKPSTRTRVSFAAAAERLGMLPLLLRPDELQLGRGETIEDTARTLSRYASAIVVRTFAQETVRRLAATSSVPVINALTDEHHPCQALADLLTLRERFGRLEGLRVAYIGDGNNVARSLLEAAALVGIEAVAACPPGYEPALEGATIVRDPLEAAAGAHAVYTDVWVSMGDEDEDARVAALAPYQVDARVLAAARADAVFMHCLPAHRGEEVTAEVIDGPQSVVWQQAENRLPTEEALLLALVTRRWEP